MGKLIVGSKMKCPQCELEQDILFYTRLKQVDEEATYPIYKCKNCRHVFAPIVDAFDFVK